MDTFEMFKNDYNFPLRTEFLSPWIPELEKHKDLNERKNELFNLVLINDFHFIGSGCLPPDFKVY